MMRFVYGSTIFVMLAMAIFGAFGAAHGMEHGTGCFVTTITGMPCVAGIAESVRAHFDALRIFSTAIFAIGLLVFSVLLVRLFYGALPQWRPSHVFFRAKAVHVPRLRANALHWLARFEHSPSIV